MGNLMRGLVIKQENDICIFSHGCRYILPSAQLRGTSQSLGLDNYQAVCKAKWPETRLSDPRPRLTKFMRKMLF
jgi:hypothetical protein